MSNKKPTGLHHHKGLYYARKVIPADVRHLFDTGELLDCLGPDYRIACLKLPAHIAKFAAQIAAARETVHGAERAVARPKVSHRPLTLRELAQVVRRDIVETQTDAHRERTAFAADHLDEREVAALKRAAAGMASDDEIAQVVGVDIAGRAPIGSDQWRQEGQQIAGVTLEAWREVFDRLDGKAAEPSHPLLMPEPEGQATADDPLAGRIVGPDSHKTMTELAELVVAEKKPKPGTAADYRVAARLFEEHLGEARAVYTILRRDVLAFKRTLQAAPSNASKRFKGMTLPEAIKANAERAQPFDTLDGVTVAKLLSRVRTLLGWAADNDLVPSNEAAGVKVDQAKDTAGPPRIPFNADELAKIFARPTFGSDLGESQWALLIALHTGLRASEIAQIRLESVRAEDDVLCFVIEEDTKNPHSRRVVPVHSTLIELGLERRVQTLRSAGEDRLFPDWFKKGDDRKVTSTTANQTFANYIPRWLNRTLLPKLGIIDDRKKFHSFRHTLKTALARAGVSRELSDAITGHDDDSSGAGYVHNQPIAAMKEALEKIKLGGFNVEFVRPKS